jgi:hypothetical protein
MGPLTLVLSPVASASSRIQFDPRRREHFAERTVTANTPERAARR